MMQEIEAFGTRFSPLDRRGALDAITARPMDAPFAYVCTPNAVHVVNYDRGEARFRAGIDGAWLRLCDSRVVARLAAASLGVRLNLALGSDLTVDLLNGAIHPDDAITIIGGTDAMEQRLRERFGWRNLARHDPPFGFIADPGEVARCVDFVLAHPARYVFLACGAPQSELLGLRIVQRGWRSRHRAVHRRLAAVRHRFGAAGARLHATRRAGVAASPGPGARAHERAPPQEPTADPLACPALPLRPYAGGFLSLWERVGVRGRR